MQLIGMLDSPYVRRTAISLRYLNIAFEHKALSVFSTFEEFQKITPIVKAPTLVFDDGSVLLDSTLILDYAETLASSVHLMPQAPQERRELLQIISFALAACDKAVQLIYERNLRPEDKQHQPWLRRVEGQLVAACQSLEAAVARKPWSFSRDQVNQAAITSAVAWQFIQSMLADRLPAGQYPALVALSEAAELTPEFLAFPAQGPGVPPAP